MARPPKEINWPLFEDLCHLQCTQAEMASVLKVHPNTLSDRAKQQYEEPDFSTVYKKFAEGGKASLRRYQFNLAKKNASMAIFLGKVILGQKEPKEDESNQTQQALNAALQFIKEVLSGQQPSTIPPIGQELETQQSLLDQKQRGDASQIQTELGSGSIDFGSPSSKANP